MGIITDPIADLLVRIKNATSRKHKTVAVPHSKIKVKILTILKKEGFITSFKERSIKDSVKKDIVITLKYNANQSVINGVKRISKPGLRVYSNTTTIPKVLSGYGIAIISTSKGIITDKEARRSKVGGEVLAYVW